MKFKLDKGSGYMYCYNPSHYCANNAGKVMEHTFVMAESIGRSLNDGECVHHIDRDKTNNSLDNLMLMTIEDHAKLHQIEDRGAEYFDLVCKTCKCAFTTTNISRVFCSDSCYRKSRLKFEISKQELEVLVWKYPTVRLAKVLGVSDVAIAKRCKKLGITKPPRGYWRKLETGSV